MRVVLAVYAVILFGCQHDSKLAANNKPKNRKARKCLARFSKAWKTRPAVIVHRPDREICNPVTQAGRLEYQLRIRAMLLRQGGLCCNCRKPISEDEQPTFEHENGRGGGKRDDRIMVDGKPLNGASHLICNSERGSKRTPIWHGEI